MGKTFSLLKTGCVHCVKSIPFPSYSGPHFPAFALNTKDMKYLTPYSLRMRENTDQNNSEYGHFSRRGSRLAFLKLHIKLHIKLAI